MKHFLITGAAGFIGFHLTRTLLKSGINVIGVDNINEYYDVNLKIKRLDKLKDNPFDGNFKFFKTDIQDNTKLEEIFKKFSFDCVINLAAQAGVRYSIDNPKAYIDSNIIGFSNLMEFVRSYNTPHFIYASSSSVYGMNTKIPFSTADNTDYPISLYAATKKSNEVLAYSYSHLFNIPMTGLRFFTVYGPWGRPDMAYYKFTEAILSKKPIDIYNCGEMKRDFTYIDDIVDGIIKVSKSPPANINNTNSLSTAPHRIYNIGNNNPVSLEEFVNAIENACNINAIKNMKPMQPGDVPITYADIDEMINDFNYKPSTSINDGIKKFVDWYKEYKNK